MIEIKVGDHFFADDTAYEVIKVEGTKIIAYIVGTHITKEFDLKYFRKIEDVPEHE